MGRRLRGSVCVVVGGWVRSNAVRAGGWGPVRMSTVWGLHARKGRAVRSMGLEAAMIPPPVLVKGWWMVGACGWARKGVVVRWWGKWGFR